MVRTQVELLLETQHANYADTIAKSTRKQNNATQFNKIKQTENKAKLVEQNKSATSPQNVSALERGDRNDV